MNANVKKKTDIIKRNIIFAFIIVTVLIKTVCVNAVEAPKNSDTWSARYINVTGVSGNVNSYTTVYMYYSTYGNTFYCNSARRTVNGANGKAIIQCTNMSMVAQEIVGIGSIDCYPVPLGVVSGVRYKVSAYTSTPGNQYDCSGAVETNR